MDDISFLRAPTLNAMREAMVSGLTARLIGEGAIDEDDEGVLLGEIDELIRRYGENTPCGNIDTLRAAATAAATCDS